MSTTLQKVSKGAVKISNDLLLGKVILVSRVGLEQIPCVHVSCPQNEFNSYLRMYFSKQVKHWALDPESQTNLGDLVLIRYNEEEKKRPNSTVQHLVDRVVFQYGNIIDPVTKRRVFRKSRRFEKDVLAEKSLIAEIVEEPLSQDSLMFDERRRIQKERLEKYKALSERLERNPDEPDLL